MFFRRSEHLDFYFLVPLESEQTLLVHNQVYIKVHQQIVVQNGSFPEKDKEQVPHLWTRSEFFPLSRCKYYDREVPCPNNPEKVVQKMYGDANIGSVCKIVRKWCGWDSGKGVYEGVCDHQITIEESDAARAQKCLKKNGYPHLKCDY
jgi:hypothetical protein